jgi:hypothetical protein
MLQTSDLWKIDMSKFHMSSCMVIDCECSVCLIPHKGVNLCIVYKHVLSSSVV